MTLPTRTKTDAPPPKLQYIQSKCTGITSIFVQITGELWILVFLLKKNCVVQQFLYLYLSYFRNVEVCKLLHSFALWVQRLGEKNVTLSYCHFCHESFKFFLLPTVCTTTTYTTKKIRFMCSQNESARLRSQFPFMYLWAIFIFPGSWEYINCSEIHECRNWERGRAVSFLGIFVSNFRYSVFAVYLHSTTASCTPTLCKFIFCHLGILAFCLHTYLEFGVISNKFLGCFQRFLPLKIGISLLNMLNLRKLSKLIPALNIQINTFFLANLKRRLFYYL